MTMKLKEIGKLPQAKIVPGQWQPPPSLPPQQTPPSVISQISQPRSLPGTMKRLVSIAKAQFGNKSFMYYKLKKYCRVISIIKLYNILYNKI